MANKFKFNIITGENAGEKYAAIANKEPFTFYLLQTGVGYLGTVKLFDASTIKDSGTEVTGKFFRSVKPHVITQNDLDNENMEMPDGTAIGDSGIVFISDYNDTDDGDETLFFVPVKADVDVTGKYFRSVESHVITEDDLDDDNMSKPADTVVGDTGLVFTADNNDTDDGDEKKYFVPIKVEKPDITESITDQTPATKIPTVAAVINYVTEVMQDKVSFEIDGESGIETADGGMSFPGVYSTEEVRVGTWTNGEPLYRKVLSLTSPGKTNTWTQLYPEIECTEMVKIDAYAKTGGGLMTYNLSFSAGYSVLRYTTDGTPYGGKTGLVGFCSSSDSINLPITVILEYTKTTD